jgi:CO dehydrogenase nickel-insertion accessory protein CooC1
MIYWFTGQPGAGKTVLATNLKTHLEDSTNKKVFHIDGASIEISSLLGLGELIIKPILYFLHERVWYKWIRIKK